MSKKNKEAADVQSFNRISARANILLNIMFLILALICVIPAVLVVSISFSAEQSITDYGYRLIPKIISLDGYGYLLKQGALIIRALGVSLFVTIVGTALGTLLTTLMGYVLSRPDYKPVSYTHLLALHRQTHMRSVHSHGHWYSLYA